MRSNVQLSQYDVVLPEPEFTGHQVFFLRNHLGMTLREFSNLLEVTHPVVKQWEKCEDESTKMSSTFDSFVTLFLEPVKFGGTRHRLCKF